MARMGELLAELHTRNLDPASKRELEQIDRAATAFVAAATATTQDVDQLLTSFDQFEEAAARCGLDPAGQGRFRRYAATPAS